MNLKIHKFPFKKFIPKKVRDEKEGIVFLAKTFH